MSGLPKVSVLIPTYNYGRFLDETIQSVLDQTFTDLELIIVDNCSTDNTAEVVKKYLTDSRIHYFKNETNIGLIGNWSKCLEYAQGEYIKFLCADDKFHPQLLQKFVAVLDEHPNISLITSFFEFFGAINVIRSKPFTGQVKGLLAMKDSLSRGSNWFGEPTAIMLRKADLTIGGFNPQLFGHNDWESCLRLLTLGDCYIVPEVLYYIRWHPDNQTAQMLRKKFESTFEAYKFFKFIQKTKQLQNFIGAEMDVLVKEKAIACSKIIFRVIPGLYKIENRRLFKRAYRIGQSEGVVFVPLLRLVTGKK